MASKLTAALIELDRQRRLRSAEDNEIERLTVLAEIAGTGYGSDAPRGSSDGDRRERAYINLTEFKDAVKRDRRARTPIRLAALSVVWHELDREAAYIAQAMADSGQTVEEIATDLGYSTSWVYAKRGL